MTNQIWKRWAGGFNDQMRAMTNRQPDVFAPQGGWRAEGIKNAKEQWAAGLRRIYVLPQDAFRGGEGVYVILTKTASRPRKPTSEHTVSQMRNKLRGLWLDFRLYLLTKRALRDLRRKGVNVPRAHWKVHAGRFLWAALRRTDMAEKLAAIDPATRNKMEERAVTLMNGKT